MDVSHSNKRDDANFYQFLLFFSVSLDTSLEIVSTALQSFMVKESYFMMISQLFETRELMCCFHWGQQYGNNNG